jgi:hypothetical protein
MARAGVKGTRIGRRELGIELRQQIAKRTANGETVYRIAKYLGIDRRCTTPLLFHGYLTGGSV